MGNSPAMQGVYQTIQKASRTDVPVLVLGETGAGKEAVARLIHHLSHRKNNLFVKVNCPAFSPHLIESELFGHEKGAFTGADSTRLGRVEIANNGTLFLDEIDEFPLNLQAKLLHILEDRCFERVGSSFAQKSDVRFIVASNKKVSNLIKEGRFREDLYYRINVLTIYIPPLRERKEDIIPLIEHFFTSRRFPDIKSKRLNQKTIEIILDYTWPGNVRELLNFLQRISILINEEEIMPEHITDLLEKYTTTTNTTIRSFTGLPLYDVEKETIMSTLSHFDGNLRKASQVLGITDRTIRNKIKLYSNM
ncbi:MAG: sigma-54 dependent transcriptional regulator [Planctomycetota bacterium]|nr:sigma-54 dependent transcriptional regulator [Planctomycetota bacterium]MDI6786861.1 sigma-54 dependent transcriptional regulator [Planctomycetota bacterium]